MTLGEPRRERRMLSWRLKPGDMADTCVCLWNVICISAIHAAILSWHLYEYGSSLTFDGSHPRTYSKLSHNKTNITNTYITIIHGIFMQLETLRPRISYSFEMTGDIKAVHLTFLRFKIMTFFSHDNPRDKRWGAQLATITLLSHIPLKILRCSFDPTSFCLCLVQDGKTQRTWMQSQLCLCKSEFVILHVLWSIMQNRSVPGCIGGRKECACCVVALTYLQYIYIYVC